jgi:hypothetical protein
MRLVYATGRPHKFEFAVANGPLDLPGGARVLAVCDGPVTDSRLDEPTFRAMTDAEFYTLQGLIASSQRLESARLETLETARPETKMEGRMVEPLRRLLRRVAGRS